ncbi:MAG: CAP domain-containing protein [Coprobacillus sp.]
MKHILSIITIIVLSLGLSFYKQKDSSKQVNMSTQTHIEPEKKIETTKIKKEIITNEVPQKNNSQIVQSNKQTNIKKDESISSPPVEKEVETYSQYLSNQQINQIKSELLILINNERSTSVSLFNSLETSSSLRAYEAYQKWSHTRPNGTKWNTTLSGIININNVPHGENLGQIRVNPSHIDISYIVSSIHNGLINSPTHYKVMTNENYKKVNIGVYSILNNNMITITIAQHYIR